MIILAVVSLAQFLIALDYSIVYLALPSMARGLDLTPALAPWVVSAYAVLFAGFLVVGGRLTDRFGAHAGGADAGARAGAGVRGVRRRIRGDRGRGGGRRGGRRTERWTAVPDERRSRAP